ncbi:MAG: MBL fold metallo-hydrolase [Povalibacter sp.]
MPAKRPLFGAAIRDYAGSAQLSAGRFRNAAAKPTTKPDGKVMWDFFFNKPRNTVPATPVPIRPLTRAELEAAPTHSLYRLGHSTLLMKLRSGWWLTDPVFSKRASPFSFLGPKRFHAPPIALSQLPAIRGVILSHDHYDHLDKATIKVLAQRAGVFVSPLGVGDRLVSWGVPRDRVRQLDWWQSVIIDGVHLTATPSQHFSGRGLRDGNRTLWCSWVIEDESLRAFFSGDGGYFNGFAEIGRRCGPFNLTLMETGAYNEHWPYVHMQPEETVQAHQDLGGGWLLPIHNGTFDLAMHAWYEPFERVVKLGAERGIQVTTPTMGERLDMNAPHAGDRWWRNVLAEEQARHAKTSGNAKRLRVCARG